MIASGQEYTVYVKSDSYKNLLNLYLKLTTSNKILLIKKIKITKDKKENL